MKVKNFKHIFTVVLIIGFIILAQGCGTDPSFWSALGASINSGIADGTSSSSSSSSTSGSSGGSSSYNNYVVTLINNSSVTVTVYAEGKSYKISPGNYATHSSRNSDIDWDYEPSYLDAYFNRVYQSLTFSD